MKWLRANVWSLLAVVVLGTGAVLYSFAFDWRNYQEYQPHDYVVVPRGEAGAWGKGTIALEEMVVLEGDTDDGQRYGVEAGTDVVVADVRITPDPEGVEGEGDDIGDYYGCDIRFRAPSPIGEREWWSTSFNPTTYPESFESGFGCNVGYGEPYDLRLYFVTPAGGAENGFVHISYPEALPRALHLY